MPDAPYTPPLHPDRPTRVLVVLPSWLGDAVMATPALRLLRDSMPGAFIGALCRPGIDQLLAGLDLFDELHVERPTGVMGPKHAAAKVRPRRYEAALLLTNSFSTALITRLAGIPRRVGYQRDGRGVLLTDRLTAPKRPDGSWAPVPAVNYYWHAAHAMVTARADRPSSPPPPLDPDAGATTPDRAPLILPEGAFLELAITEAERTDADRVLASAGAGRPYAVLNPGGNNPAKRWPVGRFAALADHLHEAHGLSVLLNGSPGEIDLLREIADAADTPVALLPEHGGTIATLKPIIADAALLVTNDTGPRHIAVALGTPCVSLFGPTDARWTTVPTRPGAPESVLIADDTLPPGVLANDEPERCRIDRIGLEAVVNAADGVLRASQNRSEASDSRDRA